MANSPQARKRARQSIKRRARNMSQRAAVRTYIKKFQHAVDASDVEAAQEAFRTACSRLDRIARKGGLHRNKAARLKSRMNARLKILADSAAA